MRFVETLNIMVHIGHFLYNSGIRKYRLASTVSIFGINVAVTLVIVTLIQPLPYACQLLKTQLFKEPIS